MNLYRLERTTDDPGPWAGTDPDHQDICEWWFAAAESEADARHFAVTNGEATGDEPAECWSDTRWSTCVIVARDAVGVARFVCNSLGVISAI